MTSIVQQSPFLRVQRNFPPDNPQALSIEVDRAYCDTAAKVNARTIGIFPLNMPIITGEKWFINSTANGVAQTLQSLRQVYTFTGAGNIAHGINFTGISGFSRIYGTFTDGTDWYPLPYVDAISATNQVALKVTPTNIVITAGAGSPPSITSGYVVLEWLSVV
jgi:hypothetical protein